jgi:tetratricopeptide (TPR) repeat protein
MRLADESASVESVSSGVETGKGRFSACYNAILEASMKPNRVWSFTMTAIVASTIIAAGCATSGKKAYTDEEITKIFNSRIRPELRDEVVIPFEIDDEIRALAHKAADGIADDRQKMRAIVNAIIDRTGLSISYDWLSNKTAKEVFYEGRGNCLAYTNLYVGMAREVGLQAVYVDVTTIERVSREAEVIVNNGHITGGFVHGADVTVIDFTRTPEREYYGFKVINDLEAIANFYNNQGFLYGYFTEIAGPDMGFDPQERELEMYNVALEILPTFHRARNNLGVAYKRRGKIDEAIEQYQMAIDHDPDFAEAHSNLGSAYYTLGRTEDAMREFRIAAKDSGSNAYFYHHLGVIQFQLKQYKDAIAQFRRALSREPNLADARFFIGECYLKLGDTQKAIEEFRATLELDPNYLSARAKLAMLDKRTEG